MTFAESRSRCARRRWLPSCGKAATACASSTWSSGGGRCVPASLRGGNRYRSDGSPDWLKFKSGGSGGETGCRRGWGELILDRSLARSLFANRFLGEFSRPNSSTSRASRVHVRPMSTKTSRTRALGARSANCWQSYERFLHIAAVSTAQSPSVGYLTHETRTRDSEIGSGRKRCGGTAFLGSTLLP
jgi:hypothetical protein